MSGKPRAELSKENAGERTHRHREKTISSQPQSIYIYIYHTVYSKTPLWFYCTWKCSASFIPWGNFRDGSHFVFAFLYCISFFVLLSNIDITVCTADQLVVFHWQCRRENVKIFQLWPAVLRDVTPTDRVAVPPPKTKHFKLWGIFVCLLNCLHARTWRQT